MSKRPTAAIAREIYRRENGYEPDTSIDLIEYGYDENTTSQKALSDAAQLPAVPNVPEANNTNPGTNNSGANTSVYDDQKNDFANQIFNADNPYYDKVDSMEKPEYTSTYDDQINSLVDSILNGEKFDYDVNEDALFQNYASIYERNARMAADNAMGNAMAASGGYGNSYAAALADQAYNSQMQGLNEIVPELQQLAYAKYQNEKNDAYNQLDMLNNMENQEYSKYRDDVSDYYTDINMQLGLGDRYNADLLNKFNVADQLENEEYNREYQENRDAVSDEHWDKEFEYSKEQFEYGKEQDAYSKELNEALIAAEAGNFDDLSQLLGVDMTEAKNWFDTQRGIELYSATGVVDYLKNAGIDTSVIEKNMQDEEYRNALSIAMSVYEATGSPELLKKLGIDTSYMDEILKYSLMSSKKASNGSSGGSGGGNDKKIDIDLDNLSDQGALDILTGTYGTFKTGADLINILSGNGAKVNNGVEVTSPNTIENMYVEDSDGTAKTITEEEWKKYSPAKIRK